MTQQLCICRTTPFLWSVCRIGEDGESLRLVTTGKSGPCLHPLSSPFMNRFVGNAVRRSEPAKNALFNQEETADGAHSSIRLTSVQRNSCRFVVGDKGKLGLAVRQTPTHENNEARRYRGFWISGEFAQLKIAWIHPKVSIKPISRTRFRIFPIRLSRKSFIPTLQKRGSIKLLSTKCDTAARFELVDYLKNVARNEMLDDGVRRTAATTVARISAAPWVDDRPAFEKHRRLFAASVIRCVALFPFPLAG